MGFTAPNRRQLLLSIAAASTAAASATANGTPSESPDLISLGDKVAPTLDSYLSAEKVVADIVAEWGPQWPMPDINTVRYGGNCHTHRDILGRGVQVDRFGNGRLELVKIGTPEYFEADYRDHMAEAERKSKFKSQRGMKQELRWAEMSKVRIEPARAYWSEVERITEASGITPAKDALTGAREALMALTDQIVMFEERSIAGLVIKAEALQAWSQVDPFYQVVNPKSAEWQQALAATIMRQAGGGSSAALV